MSIIWNFKNSKKIGSVTYPVEQERVVIDGISGNDTETIKLIPEIKVTRKDYRKVPNFTEAIESPSRAIEYVKRFFENTPSLKGKMTIQEVFGCIYLNQRNIPMGITWFAMGANNAVVAPTQLLFHTALSLGANGIFVFHNHPSGSMEFSLPDKKLSKDIAKGAEYLKINYIDFVVITSDGLSSRFMDYYSARENEPDLLQS